MNNQNKNPKITSDIILIRYGEIYLKSRYVRNQFEQTLMTNIHQHLKAKDLPDIVTRDRGRLYLQTKNIPQALTLLPNIFGITSFNPAITTTSQKQDITKTAQKILQPLLTKKTSFALRVTRNGSHPYTSQDIAIHVGNAIVSTTQAPVNLTNPDIELYIEIRHKHAYLFTTKTRGPGGLPLGTQGNALIIIDTTHALLAAWYLMRRGCTPHFILTKKTLEKNLTHLLNRWYPITNPTIYKIPQKELLDNLNHYATKHHCDAIITGHILTNKQDIDTIQHYKTQLHYPILHPLIALTKPEITQKAKEVGICL